MDMFSEDGYTFFATDIHCPQPQHPRSSFTFLDSPEPGSGNEVQEYSLSKPYVSSPETFTIVDDISPMMDARRTQHPISQRTPPSFTHESSFHDEPHGTIERRKETGADEWRCKAMVGGVPCGTIGGKNQIRHHTIKHLPNDAFFECPICQEKFRSSDTVRKHIQNIHIRQGKHIFEQKRGEWIVERMPGYITEFYYQGPNLDGFVLSLTEKTGRKTRVGHRLIKEAREIR
jgi:hypothetical protein